MREQCQHLLYCPALAPRVAQRGFCEGRHPWGRNCSGMQAHRISPWVKCRDNFLGLFQCRAEIICEDIAQVAPVIRT